MPKGYIVDVEFTWGFQSSIIGLSKTPPSFYYPPPTTFLGALAESIARNMNIGEDKGRAIIPALSRELLAIGLRPINCIPLRYEDLNRIVAIKKTAGKLYPRVDDLKGSFDSPARGKTSLSTLNGNNPTVRFFTVFKDGEINLEMHEVKLSKDHFWKIHRLGSKESRVSVVNVIETYLLPNEMKRTITNYSFPALNGIKTVEVVNHKWEVEKYVDPFKIEKYDKSENPIINYIRGYGILPFYLPILTGIVFQPKYLVELDNGFSAYKYNDEVVIGYG
ncbi:MAG: type I-A CRISPR-associated protein Cas5a [Candidatus Methanomethylicia archaeon]